MTILLFEIILMKNRPRIMRLYEVTDFSIHDVALVDCKLLQSSIIDKEKSNNVFHSRRLPLDLGHLHKW